jgi:hypothetical protein
LISQPAVAAVFTPAWANETPTPDTLSITRRVLLWAGLVAGGGIMLIGLFAVPIALIGVGQSSALAGAVVFVIVGGAVFVPCLAMLSGFGPVVRTTLHSLGILGCVVVVLMALNTAVAVTSPVGGARLGIPLGTFALVVFRAWRGRWLGAAIIGCTWLICMAILLTLFRR